MKQRFYLFILSLFSFVGCVTGNAESTLDSGNKLSNVSDTLSETIHTFVKQLFYNLPLEKSRKDIREVMIHDGRFLSTDTSFNNYKPSSFFKGVAQDKGIIKSNPDSIKVLLVYGNAPLATNKGQHADFTDVMILACRYFYTTKDSAAEEYIRLLDLLHSVFKDSSARNNEVNSTRAKEEFFVSFDPYYDITLSLESVKAVKSSKGVFCLSVAFRKEDT